MNGWGAVTIQYLQDRESLFCFGYDLIESLFASLVFVEVLVSLVINLGNELSQIGIQCFSYYLPTDILDQPVAVVAPSPQFAYCFQVLCDRTPGLLAGLETIALVQVLTRLDNEPTTDGPAVVGALQPWLR